MHVTHMLTYRPHNTLGKCTSSTINQKAWLTNYSGVFSGHMINNCTYENSNFTNILFKQKAV